MKIISVAEDMQKQSLGTRRAGSVIGLVPTMGALHAGHLSLIRKARELSEHVVVSLFINPIQFGPSEDLDGYPSVFDRDREICEAEAVDTLFCPSNADMYRERHSTYVLEEDLSRGLCGPARPGHFRGVTTVVAKLFNLVVPDVAVFGQKDAQQVRVLQRMVRDLNFPVRLVVAPTVRESDGLAMSSRNAYLSEEERKQATCLHAALVVAETLYAQGVHEADVLKREMKKEVAARPLAEIEYMEIVDDEMGEAVSHIERPARVALCVRFGKARLIDNTVLGGT